MSTSLVIPGKFKLKKYRVNNIRGGSDIINADLNPIVINDTTAVSTTANSYTQVKSYSNIGGIENYYGKYMVNAIRLQIYGYVSAGTGYVQIQIDGSTNYTVLKAVVGTPAGTSFTNTSSALLIDAIIALNASTSHTVTINAYNSTSGDSTTISAVYGFQGYAITSTSLTEIDSETLSNYIVDEIGFSYDGNSGIHAAAFVNRSTSATATLQFSDNFTLSGYYGVTLQPPAGNDAANAGYWSFMTDNNGTGQPPQGYNGSWSWNAYGEVGASGDVLIIGNLYIWFAPHFLLPPSDLLVSISAISLAIPGVTAYINLNINPNYNVPNSCVSVYCANNLLTIISVTNNNSSSSPDLAIGYNTISLVEFTPEMMLQNGASGAGILAFIEIEAITI